MPVTAQTPVNTSTGNGVTTTFPYNFKILAEADIEVSVDGVVKTLTTHYTLTGVGNDAGGNVLMVSAPANGAEVVRRRVMSYDRTDVDYQENGDLLAATLDEDVDRVVMMVQQLDSDHMRAIKFPVGTTDDIVMAESAAERAGKVLLFDASGNPTVGEAYDAAGLAAALAASGGASLVGFLQAGTGAVARTLQAKARDVVSVLDFGAVGDGTTDDTTAIQNAINAVNAAGGAVLQFAPGKTYIVSGLVPKTGVLLDLQGSTLKLKASSGVPVIYDGGSGAGGDRFGVVNGTIDCNRAGSGNDGANVLGAVWLSNWTNLTFACLKVQNCPSVALNILGCSYVTIKDYSLISGANTNGAYFAYGIVFGPYSTTPCRYVTVDNVSISNITGYGIHFYKTQDFAAHNLNFDTLNYSTSSIAITCTEAVRGTIRNVKVNSTTGDAIEINDSTDVWLDQATVASAGRYSIMVGVNTVGNYNNRVRVSNLKATSSGHATYAALFSAGIDCEYSNLILDKSVTGDSSLASTARNTLKHSTIGGTVAASPILIGYGFFTLEDVEFTDFKYRVLKRQYAEVSLQAGIANGAAQDLVMSDIAPTLLTTDGSIGGVLSVLNSYSSAPNQGSFQTCSFVVNNAGTAANLSTVTTVASAVSRALTITGTAASKKLVLTNSSGVDLVCGIDLKLNSLR